MTRAVTTIIDFSFGTEKAQHKNVAYLSTEVPLSALGSLFWPQTYQWSGGGEKATQNFWAAKAFRVMTTVHSSCEAVFSLYSLHSLLTKASMFPVSTRDKNTQ